MTGARLVAAAIALLAFLIVVTTLAWPSGNQGVPGPALVPRLLGVALLATALLIVRAPAPVHRLS